MSASQEKKKRQQQREQGIEKHQVAEKEAAEKEKVRKRRNWIVGIVAAVVVLAIIVASSNLPYTAFTAVSIGDKNYNAAEFNFYYNNAYYTTMQQFGDYAAQLIDPNTPLDQQQYSEDQTWADFFKQSAIDEMKNITMLCSEANKEGFALSEEDSAELESAIESIKNNYDTSTYSNANEYLEAQYGNGVTVSVVSSIYEDNYLANAYSEDKYNSFEYSDSDLDTAYDENADNYDKYTYITYYSDGSVPEEAEADTAEATEDTDAAEVAMASAKEIADSIVEDSKTAEDFKKVVLALTESEVTESTSQGTQLSANYADWLKDSSRKEGDTTVIESDTGYYVLFFIGRDNNDYNTANFRHILCYALPDEAGEYTDETKQVAEDEAEKLLEEWKNGDATEESFAELANLNSDDGGSNTKGGLYENVSKGTMVSAVNDFIFEENRKIGDTEIVFNDGNYTGYHVLYFAGEGKNYRKVLAENDIRTEDYNNWKTAALENFNSEEGFGARFVG